MSALSRSPELSHRRMLLPLLLAGCACDSGALCAFECGAPFVCVEAPDGEGRCGSALEDRPACRGTPAGQIVPFAVDEQNTPIHWLLAPGCLGVSYAPELTPRLADIEAALSAWEDVACSRLCFSPPQLSTVAPEPRAAERRIHFMLGRASTLVALVEAFFENTTGRTVTAQVTIEPEKLGSVTPADFVALVGQAIGLAEASEGADAVMAEPIGGNPRPSSLRPADVSAICTLYGTPSYCGE